MAHQNRKLDKKSYEEQLIIEANLQDRFYSYNKIQPTAFFWKQLTSSSTSQTPMCLIPDTLVLNQKQSDLIWFYTDASGRIRKETNISFKDFVIKLTSYSSPNQLVAILKRPIFNQRLGYSNEFKLFNSKYLLNSSQQQMGQKDCVSYLQRFIKCNGSKAFLCRTIYSSQCSSECFIITNSRNFLDKNQIQNKKFVVKAGDKSTIVKSKQGKNLEQTLNYLKQIIKFLKLYRGIEMLQMVGDFLKDEMGNWWLVNIKAFKILQKLKKNPKAKNILNENEQLQKERYQKTKLCRYCQKSYLQSELNFKMTMRMIIEVDKYLLHLGKEYNWLKRSDVGNIDSHFLYQEHKVCERCFRLYSQIQELMQVQAKLLVKQGFQLIAHPKQLIFSQTNEQNLRLQAKNKQIHRLNVGIPQVVELGPNTNITTVDKYPIKNDQIISKMYRFRLILFLNQIDQVVNINPQCNYFLQFQLFNKKSKYKLNLSMIQAKIIPLNKLKIFYFFSNSIQKLEREYLTSNSTLNIYILQQNRQSQEKRNIGSLQIPLKQLLIPFNRKKDFYKFFHIENIAYGWGLQGSIGIISSQDKITTAKISFQKTQGQMYIPNQNYYFCEHLTQQWIDLIKTKYQKFINKCCTLIKNKMLRNENNTNQKLQYIKSKNLQSLQLQKYSRQEIDQMENKIAFNQVSLNNNNDNNNNGNIKNCLDNYNFSSYLSNNHNRISCEDADKNQTIWKQQIYKQIQEYQNYINKCKHKNKQKYNHQTIHK